MTHPTPLFGSMQAAVREAFPELVSLRRQIHQNPELSRREFATTSVMAKNLERLGFTVHVRPEGTGLWADLAPSGFDPARHPTVAIRGDMDALPIQELNELAWRSRNEGVMHACGHDVHTTCVYGASRALEAIVDELPGRLRIICQHAEEAAPSGAPEMIEFGAADGVDAFLALHCDPLTPIGRIGVRVGALTAAFDRFTFKIIGEGGHGARPHHSIDPIYTALRLCDALYALPARRFDAREPVVVSIGEFHAGHASNIIPDEATLSGSVRTVSPERREEVRRALYELAQAACAMTGARYELDLYKGAPAIVCHPAAVGALRGAAIEVLGEGSVEEIEKPSMGSEDFSHYLTHAPGAMFRLGTAAPGREVHKLHTARFDVDERCLAYGARILSGAALSLMQTLAADRAALDA